MDQITESDLEAVLFGLVEVVLPEHSEEVAAFTSEAVGVEVSETFFEGARARTFESDGVMTHNRGVRITLRNGQRFCITIVEG